MNAPNDVRYARRTFTVRRVPTDERGFFLTSALKTVGGLLAKGATAVGKLGVSVVKSQLGIQPSAQQPQGTADTSSTTARQAVPPTAQRATLSQAAPSASDLSSVLAGIKADFVKEVSGVAKSAGEAAAQGAAESQAVKQKQTMLIIGGVAAVAVIVVALFATRGK